MLTGRTDNACPLATGAATRAKNTAASTLPAAVCRYEFNEIIESYIGNAIKDQ
jgi:hypothetical protein